MSRIGRPFVSKTFADADSVRAQDLSYDGTDSIKAKVDSISGGSATKISFPSQTIDGGLSAGEPAWYDAGSLSWKKATSTTSNAQGLFIGSGEIVFSGRVTGLSGLTAGKMHWLADSGGLTANSSTSTLKTKIGYAQATDVLLVDIDTESSLVSVALDQLSTGQYHFIVSCNPFPSSDFRVQTHIGRISLGYDGRQVNNVSLSDIGINYENWHKITISGSLDASSTLEGGNANVGTRNAGGTEEGIGSKFDITTTGTFDKLEIKIKTVFTGATDVFAQIRTGHVIDGSSGTLVREQTGVTLDQVGEFAFEDWTVIP